MLNWWSRRDHARQSCHSDTASCGCWCCFAETTGFLGIWPQALVRTSWSVVHSSKYHPEEDEVWSCGSRSPNPICLSSTQHYSATARIMENGITKPCLPFKMTMLTAASTCGRPWWSKGINFYGICWSFAEVQLPTLPMMRFFVCFSCRNFHSPFAWPLWCTKMPASVSLPTWHKTW